MGWFRRSEAGEDAFSDVVLDPLPPQSRSTPSGRAMLALADFAGRALSATGFVLLAVAGAANLGVTLLAVLLHRAAPGHAVLAFILVIFAWAFWLLLAFLRWRINTAGPGLVEDTGEVDAPASSNGGFAQRATAPEADDAGEGDFTPAASTPPSSAEATHRETAGSLAADGMERSMRAADEFSIRRNTPMPRVEAAQRSIRMLVGGPDQPAWVRFDLRTLVVAFVGVAISVPVMLVTAAITLIALLVATAPF